MRILALAIIAFSGCFGDSGEPFPEDGTTTGPSTGPTGSSTSGPTGGPAPPGNATNRTWPDPDAATIRPGVQAVADGQQCTSNFVFTSPHTQRVYLGVAAHCVADAPQTGADPCGSNVEPFPLGTSVEVEGADHAATLVYSSWLTMQETGASGQACSYNDFAVLEIHPDDEAKVSPAVRFWGGPTELAPAGSSAIGSKALTYGNSGTRLGFEALRPREGWVVSESAWSTTVYFETPGVPGDSGSAVLHGDGSAMGVLVTVGLAPLAGSNGVTSLDMALQYAGAHGTVFELATWDTLEDPDLP